MEQEIIKTISEMYSFKKRVGPARDDGRHLENQVKEKTVTAGEEFRE